jgi:type III restriction enzyme
MLREGFDVNNICVIVPLRSSTSGILLEQTIGRGLRLMWRGNKEIDELKRENRQAIMVDHKPATNYFDVLSIVEHPAFREFYDELINDGLIGEDLDGDDGDDPGKIKGDLITVGLKDDYMDYDFRLPLIVNEAESTMKTPEIDVAKLTPFGMSYDSLIKMVPDRELWIDKEVTEGVRAGFFEVTTGVFRSTSYNDYLSRLTNHIVDKLNTADSMGRSHDSSFPVLSINNVQIVATIDRYIRTRLFNREIDPAEGKNWKVLLIDEVMNHIIGQISSAIIALQEEEENTADTNVIFTNFSSVNKITVRENYCIELRKCIYEKCPYPSNKGGFEQQFMDFCDLDGEVDAICKIIENRHTFARFRYVRNDGMPAEYIPDFVVRIGGDNYLVETKAQNQLSNPDVVRKKRAALRWVERINELPSGKREDITWHYVLLGEKVFYDWKRKNATAKEILGYCELKNDEINFTGKLF